MARLLAGQFGISEQEFTLYSKNRADYLKGKKDEEDILRRSGVSMDDFAKASHVSEEQWRLLAAHMVILEALFSAKLLPTINRGLELVIRILDGMVNLHRETQGWSTVIFGIATAFGGIVGSLTAIRALTGVLGIGGSAAAGGGAAIAGGVGTVAAIGGLALGDAALLAYDAIQAKKLYLAYKQSGTFAAASDSVKGFIAHFEGLRLRAYADHGQSIGYGHHLGPGDSFAGGITRGQADSLLDADTAKAADAVRKLVTVPINQNMLTALTDFVYNLGGGTLAKSTLLKKLNAGDYAGAADQFERFNKERVNGQFVTNADLTARRLGEKSLFLRPSVTMSQKTDIHITGSGDPNKAGIAVSKEQTRVNGDMVRNLAGVGAPQ